MTDDIIRIDGKDYTLDQHAMDLDEHGLLKCYLRPKRKQTGWICTRCHHGVCVTGSPGLDRPPCCAYDCEDSRWQPFYGKVVE